MELRFYLQTLLRQKKTILITMVLFGLIGYFLALSVVPTRYNGSVFFTIAYRDDQQTEDYKIGNYWANQASIEFARTVSGWPENPRLIDEIYATAGVNKAEDINLLGKLLGAVNVKRVERANINLTFNSASGANADKIADAIVSVFQTKIEEYNNEVATNYRIIGVAKAFEEKIPDPYSFGWVGIILGLIFGIIFAYLFEFFRGVVTHPEQIEDTTGIRRFDTIKGTMNSAQLDYIAGYYISNPHEEIIIGGLQTMPNKFLFELSKKLEATLPKLDLIDGSIQGPGLHKYFKKKPLRLKELTGVTLKRKWVRLDKESDYRLMPRSINEQLTGALIKSLMTKGTTCVSCNLPLQLDILNELPKADLLLLVKLGETKKETLKSVVSYLGDRSYKLIIVT